MAKMDLPFMNIIIIVFIFSWYLKKVIGIQSELDYKPGDPLEYPKGG
jgi:hypothetical protein